jgi:hypothetical protein
VQDLPAIGIFGAAAGFMAVLVMTLYITSPKVSALYHQPFLLWLICPLLLYWISRMWLITYRGLMDDDPVVFAMMDKGSYIVGGFALVIALSAI